jgi:amino acid adenylation domain-containing protein
VSKLLHDRVARTAQERGEAPAILLGGRTVGYGDVELRANRIAHALVDSGCRPGDRVALLLPKTPETVIAMLGTLKAGCAYVPVDLASPAARAARILESADPRVVLVASSAARLLDGILAHVSLATVYGTTEASAVEGERFRTRFDGDAIATLDDAAPSIAVSADAPAHLLFTSGSTGAPKGVLITHENVSAFLDWALPAFGIGPTDRLSGHPPLHFDLSTFDVFGALTAGAELHLVDPALNLTPHALARFIGDSALTQWFSVPSTMTFLASFDAVPDGGWPALERVLFCGEVLPTPVLRHWMDRLPHARFTNLYGPTEATIASSYHTFSAPPVDETAPIPIGRACDGEELLVLDEQLDPVEPGATGDLFIAGVGLSPGYWRDEEKTREAFVDDPHDRARRLYRTGDLARVGDDGLFYFLGRDDSQIKSRGYRIELGEIESALNAVDGVRECAVVGVDTGGFEGTAICAACAPGGLEAPHLRSALAEVLPSYMLPSRWLALDSLPKNLNGKIDRRELRERFAAELEQERQRTP